MAWIIFKALICILLLKISLAQDLKNITENIDNFFENIRKQYGNVELTDKNKALIDQKVDHYINTVLRRLYIVRSREFEDINSEITGTKVFKSTREVQNLNLPGVKDVCFFKKYVGQEQWFVAALTSSCIVVYEIVGYKLVVLTSSNFVENGLKLDVVKYSGSILMAVKKLEGVSVFSFDILADKYFVREIKNFNIPDVNDLSLLRTPDRLLLGISTSSNVYIFNWSNKNFVQTQILRYFTYRLFLFHQNHTTYLITSSARKSVVFQYSEHMWRFIPIQLIRNNFLDIAITRPRLEFLLASSGSERTIVYKLVGDKVLVPFQEIGPADRLVTVNLNKTALLFLLKNGILDAYQYDGWRFVRLNYQLTGVSQLKLIIFKGTEFLLVNWFDDSWSLNSMHLMKTNEVGYVKIKLQKWLLNVPKNIKQNEKLASGVIHRLRSPIKVAPKLKVNRVNEMSFVEKLQKMRERYDRLRAVNRSLNELIPEGVLDLSNLRAKTVRLNCTKQCNVKKLIAKQLKCNDFAKLRKIDDDLKSLRFEHVAVRDTLDGFPCPIPAVRLDKVSVKGLVNGISIEEFEKRVLRTSGDQSITAKLVFEELHVDSLITSNFDVASRKTRQKIRTNEIHARELNLEAGGLFLPRNGEPVMMIGKLDVSKAKFDGLVHLRGRVRGKTIKRMMPLKVNFDGNRQLQGNYTLSNVTITNMLATHNVMRGQGTGRSFKEVATRAIPLDAKIPVRLDLLQNSTIWKDIIIDNFPKLLNKKRNESVRVTGRKIALKNVTLSDDIYSKLPMPRVSANICTMGALASDVRTSILTLDRATANRIEAGDVFGAKELYNTLADSVTSLDECDLSRKNFVGTVRVKNLNLTDFQNSPFCDFLKVKFKWYRPDLVEGPLEVNGLKSPSLFVTQGIKIPFPTELDNVIVEGNLEVEKINGIQFDDFAKNIVKVNDVVSFENITFSHLEVDNIETASTNIELYDENDNEIYFGNKVIDGDLEIEDDLSIPNVLSVPLQIENISYIIAGSIQFVNEPNIERINGKNIEKLFSKIWMQDRPTNLRGNFIFSNITLARSFDECELLNTPKFGSWKSLENRLLSKTKFQEIKFPAHFREVTAENFFTNKNSTLHSDDPYLNDLLRSSLKNIANQVVYEKWRINQLIVTGDITLFGKINNLNLSTDVLKHNYEINVTGRKIAKDMSVKNLIGLGFNEWAKDALILTDTRKLVTVTGKKTFDMFYARLLNVSGKVNRKTMKDLVSTANDQTIKGSKIIKGSIYAPSIEVKGLINKVNITNFANHQLKKYDSVQVIESDVVFNGNLRILGNMTIDGTFNGVNLTRRTEINEIFSPLLKNVANLKSFSISVKSAIKHHAKYWNKFKKVEEVLIPTGIKKAEKNIFKFRNLGDCKLLNSYEISCDGENRFILKMLAQSKEFFINKLFSIDDTPIVLQVSCGQKSRIAIHMYNHLSDSFEIAANARAPNILEASAKNLDNILWIVTRFQSYMLIIRYRPGLELYKYHLPATRIFALDLVPATHELVLVRDDGMWKLDGLTGPRHVFSADITADWVNTFAVDRQFYVGLSRFENGRNSTTLLKATYVGV